MIMMLYDQWYIIVNSHINKYQTQTWTFLSDVNQPVWEDQIILN